MSQKPDSIVAEKIIKDLLKKNLLPKDKEKEWLEKLSYGEVSPEDWDLLAELHIKEAKKNE